MTELVHGAEAARAADEAADVLFGGDPTRASAAALDAVAREVPSSRRRAAELDDVVELLVATGLASSKGDARRTLDGHGYRGNGVADRRRRPGSATIDAAPRALPAAPARHASRTTSSRFSPDQGCRASALRASVALRLADRSAASAGAPAPSPSIVRTCHELRLLENGREDRTPVRAVRRADPRASDDELLVNSVAGLPGR